MNNITNNQLFDKLNIIEQKLDKLLNLNTQYKSKNETKENLTLKKIDKKKKKEKTGNILIKKYINNLLITGDTFDKKQIIKKSGGYWNPENKGWLIKIDKFEEIKQNLELVSLSVNVENNNNKLDNIKDSNQIKTVQLNENKLENYSF